MDEIESPDPKFFTTPHLLWILVIVLLLLLSMGAAYGKQQLDDRNDTIASQGTTIHSISKVNTTFQTQVADLVSVRDNLTSERDSISAERDALAKESESLKAQIGDLQQKLSDAQSSLDDTSRQLDQARSEQSRQQTRAVNAEQLGSALQDIIGLDDQIHEQYLVFLDRLDAVNKAAQSGNSYAYSQAYQQAMDSANTLDSLFAQRNAALAKLR